MSVNIKAWLVCQDSEFDARFTEEQKPFSITGNVVLTLLTDYNGSGELMTLVEGHAIDRFRQHNQEVIRFSGISHTDATIFTEVGRRKVSIGTLALSEEDGLAKLELFKKWYEHEAIRRLREEAVAQGILKHKWGNPIGMKK